MAIARPTRTKAQRDSGMSISESRTANGLGSSTNTSGSSSGMDIINDPVTGNSYSRAPGGVYSPYTAPAGTPPAPQPVGTIFKDVGLTANPFELQQQSLYDKQGAMALRDANNTPNERSIYRDKLNLYQKEIDATNQIYTQKLAEARQQGLSNLGSGRAIQARSGTLGSDFAVSQNADITAQNTGVYNTILAEQNAKINSLLGLAKKDASEELAAKRLAQQKGLQDTISYLAGQSERAAAKAKKVAAYLLDNGIEYDQADPTQLAKIAKDYKVGIDDIKSSYLSEKKAREAAEQEARQKAIKDNSFSLSEGQSRYTYNPDTGAYDLTASKAKTYAPSSGGSGGGGGGGAPGMAGSALVNQPGYSNLTTAQKKAADSLNNLIRSVDDYYAHVRDNANGFGTDLTGESSAVTSSKLNGILFAAAQAEGTGALQKADRDVITQMFPDPSSLSSLGAVFRGGKQGQLRAIQEQRDKYAQNLAGYGLIPAAGGTAAPVGAMEPQGEVLVEVISPEGIEGTVSESELEDYINQGYTPL